MSQPSSEPLDTDTVRFGVDIGGTGIKGAPVDLATGQLLRPRTRIPTPKPATPQGVAQVVNQVVQAFDWSGPVGATFPAAVKGGLAMTAANVDKSWIGTNIETTLGAATGCPVTAINDADAAGVAEIMYGAGRGREGVVIMTTFGTGIGTALFLHGQLVPNTELGHLEIDGKDAEKRASEVVREQDGLSWKAWAKRVNAYLKHLEALFWPDLIIVGGGASHKADKFLPLLTVRTPVVVAALQNDAGIVGAAVVATGDVTRPAPIAEPVAAETITVNTPAKPAKRTAAVKSVPAEQATPPKTTAPATKRQTTTRRTTTSKAAAATTRTPRKRVVPTPVASPVTETATPSSATPDS